MSPSIHELPAELWREIFQCSMQFRDPFERRTFLLTTLAVCSTWRSIALQTPSLWSTIVLNHAVTRTRTYDCLDRRLAGFDLIEHFLEHSGQSTLNIYIQLVTSNREKNAHNSFVRPIYAGASGWSEVFSSQIGFYSRPTRRSVQAISHPEHPICPCTGVAVCVSTSIHAMSRGASHRPRSKPILPVTLRLSQDLSRVPCIPQHQPRHRRPGLTGMFP